MHQKKVSIKSHLTSIAPYFLTHNVGLNMYTSKMPADLIILDSSAQNKTHVYVFIFFIFHFSFSQSFTASPPQHGFLCPSLSLKTLQFFYGRANQDAHILNIFPWYLHIRKIGTGKELEFISVDFRQVQK